MKLTIEESTIVIGLHRIVNELDRRTRQICKSHGLTLGQFAVLEALYNKGELTIGQIKELVLSTDGTLPVIIGNLEKLSLVTRRQDTEDKRKFIISLTDAGRKIICELVPENNRMLKDALRFLSEEDRKELSGMIFHYRQQDSDNKR